MEMWKARVEMAQRTTGVVSVDTRGLERGVTYERRCIGRRWAAGQGGQSCWIRESRERGPASLFVPR